MTNLLPCPFCKNKEPDMWIDDQWQDRFVIECGECGTSKRSEYGYPIDEWNTRNDMLGDLSGFVITCNNENEFIVSRCAIPTYCVDSNSNIVTEWSGSTIYEALQNARTELNL